MAPFLEIHCGGKAALVTHVEATEVGGEEEPQSAKAGCVNRQWR